MTTLLIGLCGSLGAATRHIIEQLITPRLRAKLPWVILGINILGTAILALCIKFIPDASYLKLITTGFCGGFTTFSTVMVATSLKTEVKLSLRATYLAANIVLCIGVAWVILAT